MVVVRFVVVLTVLAVGALLGMWLLTTQRRVTDIVTQAQNRTQDLVADRSVLVSAVCARRYGPRRAKRTAAAMVCT